MNNRNENELVLRLQKGDVCAFDEIYYKYHTAVYLNILKLTGDANITEDILQEVFITLWEKRQAIDPGKSVPGWLFVISYNRSVDYLKKVIRESVTLDNLVNRALAASETEKSVIDTRSRLLEEAISKLSPQKRKVFELCKLQGKSYDETAKELSISKHTVKEYLSAAVLYVKEYVSQHPDYHFTFVDAVLLSIIFVS